MQFLYTNGDISEEQGSRRRPTLDANIVELVEMYVRFICRFTKKLSEKLKGSAYDILDLIQVVGGNNGSTYKSIDGKHWYTGNSNHYCRPLPGRSPQVTRRKLVVSMIMSWLFGDRLLCCEITLTRERVAYSRKVKPLTFCKYLDEWTEFYAKGK